MKRLLLVALLACAACAQQDAALLITIQGPFGVPNNADTLELDVRDGTQVISHRKWCATATQGCETLPVQTSLSGTVTLVQSGSEHAQVKLNATLRQGNVVVGLGTTTASFSSGQTINVQLPITPN